MYPQTAMNDTMAANVCHELSLRNSPSAFLVVARCAPAVEMILRQFAGLSRNGDSVSEHVS